MTREEAKHSLSLYRPWTNDAKAPEFAEALALARQDAELGRWFTQHCAAQSAMRAGFRKISPPAGLKEQIISEHKARLNAAKWGKPRTLSAVVGGLVILVAFSVWLMRSSTGGPEDDFTAYRSRMARTAASPYYMDLYTNSAPAIRAYLAQHQGYSKYALTKSLATATNTGCVVLDWQGHPVTMVCFHSGRPLPPGDTSDLFLFVMKRNAASNAPASDKPQFAQMGPLATAAWAQDGMVYLIATRGDEEFLKKYL